MYAVGHFALGYLTGKLTGKALKVNLNIPLVFLASIFPDIDILLPGLTHRGPLHSVLFFSVVFIPVFLFFKKQSIPYFVALIQHVLLGDFFTGGTQVFWPLSNNVYGFNINISSLPNILVELVVFFISVLVMYKSRDLFSLFEHKPSNIILSVPILTVLLPVVISYPLRVPLFLFVPHLFYLALFAFSIAVNLKAMLANNQKSSHC
jgi:membrane-bound metal-dependent hydrolase YbcI (DUF457 family)